ncbi:sensor histidine kinase [Cumulibacter soli]|uniref:sensor histidine kinase n=1 Tax=Cumulibacter soli TaxID=2546344 RepID=UPI00106898F0|nr:hypothetical protein [Cumulibacter soli]
MASVTDVIGTFARRVSTRIVADLRPATGAPVWAQTALVASIRQVAFWATAAWQVLMVIVCAVSVGVDGAFLIAANVCLAVLALTALHTSVPDELIPIALMALGLWSYTSATDIESTLTFAASWQVNVASCVASLIILRRYLLPLIVTCSGAVALTLAVVHPDWGAHLPVSIVFTQTVIVVVVRWGLPELLAVATEADTASGRAEGATRGARLARHISARIAEQSRLVHDTAINTLGAIANGGASVIDAGRVREQCARDVEELQALRDAQGRSKSRHLIEIFEHTRMPIRRSGLDDDALERLSAQLSPTTIGAILGCVREAITNAAKHSGADSVTVDVRIVDAKAIVSVLDEGVGFRLPEPAGRGIERSIRERARDGGIDAEVTSQLGRGTRVTLTVSTAAPSSAPAAYTRAELESAMNTVHKRAGLLWAFGVTAVGVALTINGGASGYQAHYAMLALMLLACAIAAMPAMLRVPRIQSTVLTIIACAVFFLSQAATSFGTEGAVHAQALAATGPFVVMLSLRPPRVVVRWGFGLWALVAATMCLVAMVGGIGSAPIVAVAAFVGVGFCVVWSIFQSVVEDVSHGAWGDQQRAFAASMSAELARASQQTYRRWLDAGLETTMALLRQIADGRRDPSEPAVAARCADEERYLRQLLQISPELAHLGRQLIASLRYARTRGVRFVLRLGDVDAPDDVAAREIATVVFDGIAATAPGDRLTVTVLPVSGGVQLTMTGSALPMPAMPGRACRHRRLESIDVVEIAFVEGEFHGAVAVVA